MPGAAPDIGAELCELGWQASTTQRRLVHLAADFDDANTWSIEGSSSAAHWIAGALDMEVSTGREWIRIGRALRRLPEIDRAFAESRLSYSKVRQLTRVASAIDEVELIALAETTPAGRLRTAIAAWLTGRETDDETERRQHRSRGLGWHTDVDGMVVGWFRLPPGHAAPFLAAVESRILRSGSGVTNGGDGASADAPEALRLVDRLTLCQQRADALAELVGPDHGDRTVTEVVLHVRGDGCTMDDGTPIAGSVVERIAPDSFIRALIHDAERRPINASGRQRHPTPRQRRLVKERDRRCVDCGGIALLHHDHVPSYEETGHTLVDELELRCAPCHRRRHELLDEGAG